MKNQKVVDSVHRSSLPGLAMDFLCSSLTCTGLKMKVCLKIKREKFSRKTYVGVHEAQKVIEKKAFALTEVAEY